MATTYPERISVGLTDGAQVQSALAVSSADSEFGAVDGALFSLRRAKKTTGIHTAVSTTGVASSNPPTMPERQVLNDHSIGHAQQHHEAHRSQEQ